MDIKESSIDNNFKEKKYALLQSMENHDLHFTFFVCVCGDILDIFGPTFNILKAF